MILTVIAMAMLIALPLMSAVPAVVAPAAGANITSATFLVNCSYANGTDITDPIAGNFSFTFNASGTEQVFSTRAGFTVSANAVWATVTSNEVTEGLGAIKCKFGNATYSAGYVNASSGSDIRIDFTAPVVTITSDNSQVSEKREMVVTWTSSDAVGALASQTVTIVSPDTVRCPTKTFTTTGSSSESLIDQETICAGYYTATITATDLAGNSATASKQFRITAPNGPMGIESISDKGTSNNNSILIAGIVLLIIIILYARKK